jgi:hypothetical protein
VNFKSQNPELSRRRSSPAWQTFRLDHRWRRSIPGNGILCEQETLLILPPGRARVAVKSVRSLLQHYQLSPEIIIRPFEEMLEESLGRVEKIPGHPVMFRFIKHNLTNRISV